MHSSIQVPRNAKRSFPFWVRHRHHHHHHHRDGDKGSDECSDDDHSNGNSALLAVFDFACCLLF